jgi:hypothetical protein
MISTLAVTTPAATKDLTTLARLKTDLGITDAAQDAALADVIREASDAIGRFCARPEGFGRETVTETWRLSGSAECLILARDILPAVASVTEDGEPLAAADYLLDGSLLRRLFDDTPHDWTARKIVVTYAAGYALLADTPYDLERACLDLCATIWASRGRDRSLRSESADGVGAVSYLDPRAASGGLPQAIADALASYRRIAV